MRHEIHSARPESEIVAKDHRHYNSLSRGLSRTKPYSSGEVNIGRLSTTIVRFDSGRVSPIL